MAEQEAKKLEAESPVTPTPPPAPEPVEFKQDAVQEKPIVAPPEQKPEESKALAVIDSKLARTLSLSLSETICAYWN